MSASPRSVEGRIAAFLGDRGLGLRAPALVGFSGGPDSTALLAILRRLGAGPLRAVYVEHGIRPESERARERALVQATARQLGVPLTMASIRPGAVAELARSEGEGIEAAARRYRHQVFRRCLQRFGAERLYLGHTRDDQLETLLMRLLGGAGGSGLTALAALAPPICRPLLGLSKTEILAYLEELRLSFSVDSTNIDESLLRNRLRRRLIPLLAEGFPGWETGLAWAAEKAGQDSEALEFWASRIGFHESPKEGFAVEAASFLSLPRAVQIRSLTTAISRMSQRRGLRFSGGRVPYRMVRAACEAIAAGKTFRGHGLELLRRKEMLLLREALDFRGGGGYFVVIDRPDALPIRLRAEDLEVVAFWTTDTSASGPREGSFRFPLVLRNRRPGDTLALRQGSKPLDVLLSEWRLPPKERHLVPVLEDRDGVVAVLGASRGGRDRYRHREIPPGGDRRLSIEVKGA